MLNRSVFEIIRPPESWPTVQSRRRTAGLVLVLGLRLKRCAGPENRKRRATRHFGPEDVRPEGHGEKTRVKQLPELRILEAALWTHDENDPPRS